MKKYRENSSACALHALVDQNAEYFMPPDQDDDDADSQRKSKGLEQCEKLIKKVSCPLHIRVEQKVYEQEREGKTSSDARVKKGFLKLHRKPNEFKNPWKRVPKI